MTRISHFEIGLAQRDFTTWWRARQAPGPSGRRLGYAQAVKLSLYRFHRQNGDRQAALAHFDQLVARRLTNAKKIADARLRLEAYLDWVTQAGVLVADHRVRIALPLSPQVVLGGEVSRLDVTSGGYRAVLLGDRTSPRWRTETRMPLIQLAVGLKYDRPADDVTVAVQLIDGTGLEEASYGSSERERARVGAVAVARRIARQLSRQT